MRRALAVFVLMPWTLLGAFGWHWWHERGHREPHPHHEVRPCH